MFKKEGMIQILMNQLHQQDSLAGGLSQINPTIKLIRRKYDYDKRQ
jgi:hypothetical protein